MFKLSQWRYFMAKYAIILEIETYFKLKAYFNPQLFICVKPNKFGINGTTNITRS